MQKKNRFWPAAVFVITAFLLIVPAGCDTGGGDGPGRNEENISIAISGLSSVAKGLSARYTAVVEVEGVDNPSAAMRSLAWSIKETGKNNNTKISLISGNGILSVSEDETLDSLTIVVASNYSPDVAREFPVQLTAAPNNDSTMKMLEGYEYKVQIFSFWEAPVGTGNNYLIDDDGKLALGNFTRNLPYSAWYLMESPDGKKAFKNIGSGNYINVEGITRAVTASDMAALVASQPNVSPYEDKDTFYWEFDETLSGKEDQTSILNYGFTTETGGAISHEYKDRTAFHSQNSPDLWHVQWRYDAGDPDDETENALWDIRIGNDPVKPGWGSYMFGIYRYDW